MILICKRCQKEITKGRLRFDRKFCNNCLKLKYSERKKLYKNNKLVKWQKDKTRG